MNDFETLAPTSRVWIYQSSRPFTQEEQMEVDIHLQRFANQWVSHNQQLKAFGKLFHGRFVVLMVDESQAGASGCSIDSSVKFIRGLEGQYGIDFFDRMTFAYLDGEEVKTAGKDDFAQLFAEGKISNDTIVFDNLVKSKTDFEASWQKRLEDSWHKRFVK